MPRRITIAVSGPPGAGTSSVSKKLAKELNLKYFSPGEVFKNRSEKGAGKALNVWKKDLGKSEEFHHELDNIQKRKAREGNVVICGKLSISLLKDLADYKVWIDCPLDIRAERVAEREKIEIQQAFNQLKEREGIERREWKRIYGIDYFDSRNSADIILNSSNKRIEEIVSEILEFIKED